MEVISGTNSWVEYRKGSMNLVITVPHGGHEKPECIPDRCGENVTIENDGHTDQVASLLQKYFKELGYEPHFVINRLHRSKVDQNRPIANACLGNVKSEMAYKEYHGFIESALESCRKPALLIDLHGQSHSEDWIELGYGIRNQNLNCEDYEVDDCTLAPLCRRFNLTAHEVICGSSSLGALLSTAGYHVVPCPKVPGPLDKAYFRGGYTALYYAKMFGKSDVDTIQIEVARSLRTPHTAVRKSFAKDLSNLILQFMLRHKYL